MFKFNHFILLTLIYCCFFISCNEQNKTKFSYELSFEKSKGLQTATYKEMMDFYRKISDFSPQISIKRFGSTDVGIPLHLVSYTPQIIDNRTIHLLINNGIHPGESDGIDASMLLIKDLVNKKFSISDNIAIHIIPSYNIGGMLNRNSHSRANQNGPESYGFRGNAKNYDLNRDFIKMDTENMKSFSQIFHTINPDVYVETHVSNGADYQYTLTHLITQHNKLGSVLGQYIEHEFRPKLEENIENKNHIIAPYVNVFGRTPEAGFSQFFDYPRYSTGYTTLWNSLGLMIETHMLKPYKKRVIATKDILHSIIEISAKDNETIKSLRQENFKNFQSHDYYKYNFKVDSTNYDTLDFKGYKAQYIESQITGQNRLKYDKDTPIEIPVSYFNTYKATDSMRIPKYYIIQSSWKNVIERLKINEIEMSKIEYDTLIPAQSISIKNYKTYNTPYEGHYPHYNTITHRVIENTKFRKGDFIINTDQKGLRYLLETLEPEMSDSFFNWNFFDTVLQQKEGFSSYVFEDYALEFLKNNPSIKEEFTAKKANDKKFSENSYEQLKWIYKKSPLYEKAHLKLPIYRVLD